MELWKKAEYETATMFSGRRRKMKRYRKQGPDVKLDVGNVEVKQRATIPKWISNPFLKYSQQVASGLFFLLIVPKHQPATEGLVVMKASQASMLLKLYRQSLSKPSLEAAKLP